MKLAHDWREVLARAWSIRFSILAAVLGGAEVAIGILADEPPIPRGSFAALAMSTSVGATIARLVAQRDLER